MYKDIRNNPLKTRGDLERAAMQLLEPLLPKLSVGCAGLRLGDSGAVYPEEVARMEGFSRAMWAIVPMLVGKSEAVEPIWALWRTGIIHGADPTHPEYWGDIGPFDQRMVEMAVMGVGMCIAKERFFDALPERARRSLYAWLNQINQHDMPENNWRFFRVLVNTGFRLCALPFDQRRLDEDFGLIEAHYESDGWYFDYQNQRDYYTPWGYHYYGLLYAAAMKHIDPERSELYLSRAREFAPRFACWFADDGEAIPYGRSLSYRFAQGAFFSAMALAGLTTEQFGWGELKGLLLRNMRSWLARPIFTANGLLSIGYGYPNLIMGEGYNAPGSPYWALKVFACLALPEDHPFWTCEEKPMPPVSDLLQEPHARMLITRSASGHVQAFTAGNHAKQHAHDEAKYEKFVYSTHFAFSVPKGISRLEAGAFDSVLALSLDGRFYHPRYGCDDYEVLEDCVRSVWHPFPGVLVESEIRPFGDWHLRTHTICTQSVIHVAEGGFAICSEQGRSRAMAEQDDLRLAVLAPWGISGIAAIQGYESAMCVIPEPNTNLFYPRTMLPTLLATIRPGKTKLQCAVLGTPLMNPTIWQKIPEEVTRHARMGE